MPSKFLRAFVVAAALLVPSSLLAQSTTVVSGTIVDPNGVPWGGASITANLSASATVTVNNQGQCISAGLGNAPCQMPVQGTWGPAIADATGKFTMSLFSNTGMTPNTVQYIFSVIAVPVLPPWGTGPQAFTDTLTITGATQDVSTSFNALAQALTQKFSGTGSVTSVSCGNLTPLFNCSVATPTATPAISFTQQTESANTALLGPVSGAAANPTFRSLVAADMPAMVAPAMQKIAVARSCPDATATVTCFVVANDGHIVTDATWSAGATVQVTISGTDPQFQCPGASYPCNSSTPGCNASQTNLPNTSCDVFKVAFGTANCRAADPGQCDGSIPAGTISSIQAGTQATLTSTASTASTTGSGFRQFGWFTLDDPPLAAAADAAYKSTVPVEVDLPCGYMGYSQSNFSPNRVTRVSGVIVAYRGYGCANFIVPPNFTCTASGGAGCLISLAGTGQGGGVPQMWTDNAKDIEFLGLGQDAPTNISTQFPFSTASLVSANTYASLSDVWVVGLFWNAGGGKTIYGQYCFTCGSLRNDVSWAAGNRCLYVNGAVQGVTLVENGYYGQCISHTIDIDGGTVVTLSGVNANWSLSSGSETAATVDTLSTFTGVLYDFGSNLQCGSWFNGGTTHIYEYQANACGAGTAGLHVQNSAAIVHVHALHFAPVGGAWLHLSAGTVHFECGNTPWPSGFMGTNAAVITGGTFQVDPCSVGGDNQSAIAVAQTAKTLFTTGAGTAFYRVHLSVECTTTSASATVTPAVLYTDTSNTVQTVTGTAATCTTLGAASNTSQDVTFRAKNATNIQYQTTIANTPTYDVSVTVEQLSLN